MGKILLVLMAAATPLLPVTVADARERQCGPRSAHTEARSPSMRVYTREDDPIYTYYYACLFRGGKPMEIGQSWDGEGAAPPNYLTQYRFAGRYLAFVDAADPGPASDPTLTFTVVDVARRRVVHRLERIGSYGNTVVTFDGRAGLRSTDPEPLVEAFDARGRTELDRGAGVRHLRLRGNTLRWFHGDGPRAYQLR
jgi:hypothetical protein